MSSYISAELRRLVRARAHGLCEYCLIHESDFFFDAEIDHIISEKHGGMTIERNLAYACALCNRAKGTDLGSVNSDTGALIRFFNPRVDSWASHFELDQSTIIGKTEIARVTIRILQLNDPTRIQERELLRFKGRYPSHAAQALICL